MEAVHQHQELAVALATLLIHEAGKEITAEHINNVLHHANVKVEGFWPIVMAKALANADIEDLIMNTAAPVAAVAPAAAAATESETKEEKKEDKKEEEEAEEDFGGFGDLF
ncbi:60S acidic ribosomal protein P1, putative [Entamoeba dispar SAW760]|uniref:60S acidic ribosomal protein P1, putative n=1 Tax=Entamoeba dispar (strain ATCC PRA-260 / SAW760) TaxID=370354 RepID=B0ERJ4_ENTDS|nr:60S acidic ribosomal protein P1, putative [Entamoeba dispar SAW760]EDR22852.1 60S acidic ribosomal protein P1, putative [Entamoeba dispar SAW760]|eukprot:EDR22852.1 60S acidic ribosomal protein P1, putative [Entamoeba dispar SAW760]